MTMGVNDFLAGRDAHRSPRGKRTHLYQVKTRNSVIPIASVVFEMGIVVGDHYVQITNTMYIDVHVTHEFANLLPYTGVQVSVIYRPLDLSQSTWHSRRSWQKLAVTSVSSSFLSCSLCSFSSLRFQWSRRYHLIPFSPWLSHH